jgi:poly(A) polymerase
MSDRQRRPPHHPPRTPHHDDRPAAPPRGLALDPPELAPAHEPEIPVDRLDPEALKVIYRLRHVGHQAYFVGGCVRDLLLGATPKDFDLATDAHPGEVRAIFRNCRLIGRRFRLAHVYFREGKVIEVATFRKNPTDVAEDLTDGGDLLITRDNVFGTAREDAVRRDFTVNGLFYDVASGEVIDYVGGREDLESRRIATIGDPEIRMREDPVRLLRAVRFAARLGFAIAPDTFEAMRRHAGELARCAPARVLEEIFKILRCGGSARAFALLRACGALPLVLPALGEALDRWDEARRKAFFAHLTALDRLVRSGEPVSEAVLLGALVIHLGTRPAPVPEGDEAPEPSPDARVGGAADVLLDDLVQSARLPRKVAERIRLALSGQRVFREPKRPGRRRRRGRGPAGQPWFDEALQLLRITVEATGEGRELLDRWVAEAALHPAEEREQPAPQRGRPARGRPERERPDRARPLDDRPRDGDTEAAPESGVVVEVEATASPGEEAGPAGPRGEAEGRRRRRRRGGRRRRRRGEADPQDSAATPG